jgi:hypothetical protein
LRGEGLAKTSSVNDLKSNPIRLEHGDELMAARKKDSVSKDKRYPWLKVPTPTLRALQVYAFDPSTGGYAGNSTTVHVPWEKLAPGPSGRKIGVVDYDSANKRYYPPVDLDDPLSFPKIRSGRIRALRGNQTIIRCDVCDHLPARNNYRRSAQVAAPS